MARIGQRKRLADRNDERDARERSQSDYESVEVVCRLTPYDGPDPCIIPVNGKSVQCVPPTGVRKRDGGQYADKLYDFAAIFDEEDDQQAVFQRCTVDLIKGLIEAKSSLLFTYGVTGSGKTYTMTGNPSSKRTGILPRTLDALFNSISNKVPKGVFYPNGRNGFALRSKLEAHVARNRFEQDRLQISSEVVDRFKEPTQVDGFNDNYVCSVFVNYAEVYNNTIYDLLGKEIVSRKDRLDPNGVAFIDGVTEVEVDSSDEALEVYSRGHARRSTCDTLLNRESSRSHSIFTIRLVMAPFNENPGAYPYPAEDPSKIVVAQMSLVDLAGSERAKRTLNTGERLAEAGNINKSLMVLRQCIQKLRSNQRSRKTEPVPYRDSKITYLFKSYFEGAGRIRMIMCTNPKPDDFEENLNVLAFAEESKGVQVARGVNRLAICNEDRPDVPRRFFSQWQYELNEKMESWEQKPMSLPPMPDVQLKSSYDQDTIDRLREHALMLQQRIQTVDAQIESTISFAKRTLCEYDYHKSVTVDE